MNIKQGSRKRYRIPFTEVGMFYTYTVFSQLKGFIAFDVASSRSNLPEARRAARNDNVDVKGSGIRFKTYFSNDASKNSIERGRRSAERQKYNHRAGRLWLVKMEWTN